MTRSRAASGLLRIGKVKKKESERKRKKKKSRRAFDWGGKVLMKGTDGWKT